MSSLNISKRVPAVVAVVGLAAFLPLPPAAAQASRADWPLFRHDARLSAVSPAEGHITSPAVLWEHYLGPPRLERVAEDAPDPRVADLDGDGEADRVEVQDRTLRVRAPGGAELFSHTVEGRPLGAIVRLAKLLTDKPGLQVVTVSNRMDNGHGQVYCFTFHEGVERGRLLWTSGPLEGYHSPTVIIDDVDGDGIAEVITAPHYRLQIFDGATGKLEAEVPWNVGRNYGILLSRARSDAPQKDLFIVCDFVLHVDRLAFDGETWAHAWGHRYIEPNQPQPRGREKYIRVGPDPVIDIDGDGEDEVVYLLIDADDDDRWHLRVRDAASGVVEADLGGVWLWSLADWTGDGAVDVVYTPTGEKRPASHCDLHVARLRDGRLDDSAVVTEVRPLLRDVRLPLDRHSIADDGLADLCRTDLDADGRPEFLVARQSAAGRFDDRVAALEIDAQGQLREVWRHARPGHDLEVERLRAAARGMRLRDLTEGTVLDLDARGEVVSSTPLGRPGGFATTPIIVDLDGDGHNEVVVQQSSQQIVALRFRTGEEQPQVVWSLPGVAMNHSPGYSRPGLYSPQAADVDGDGRPEVFFAREDAGGRAALVCADGSGRVRWARAFDGCPWGGLQAGVNLWTFGRFTGRPRGLDVYVDVHRRGKGSSEGWVLRGDVGAAVWRQQGLVAAETAMPFGGGLPAVSDVDGDGADDLVQEFWTVFGVLSGRDGSPLFPPAFLWGKEYFGRWLAYSSPTLADLDGDAKLDVYLNSASLTSGGFAAVRIDGKPLWAEFHDNDGGPAGYGPVADLDGDGALDVAVPVVDGSVVLLEGATGKRLWRARLPVAGDAVAGDVDGDGGLEIICAATDGTLRALRGKDGSELWRARASGRPVLGDVDGDRLLEVLAVGGDGVLRVVGPPRARGDEDTSR